MEKRSICLTITQIRSPVNFGNNLREAIAKKVRFNFVTLKLHRSTCYVNWAILIGDLVDVTTLLLVSNVCTKANRTLGFLRRNLYSCPQEVIEAAYKGLVCPVLDYGSSVWDPTPQA